MLKIKFTLVNSLLLLLLVCGACVSTTGGIATSNVPVNGRTFKVLGPAETTVSWWSFNIGIIGLALNEPPVDQAEKEVLAQHEGEALINLRYWNDQSVFLFLTRHRFHLKADVIRFEAAPNNRNRR
ncbi:MAG: hypothetical protein KDK39_12780 [Leptospiraceae bacterium]|nr:hypothetical protein [Leptospiraceae bacterium]